MDWFENRTERTKEKHLRIWPGSLSPAAERGRDRGVCTRFARIWISVLVWSCVCGCMRVSVECRTTRIRILLFFCWSYLWKDNKCIFFTVNYPFDSIHVLVCFTLFFFFHKYQSSLLVFFNSLLFTTIRIQVVLYSIINFTFEYGRILTRFFFLCLVYLFLDFARLKLGVYASFCVCILTERNFSCVLIMLLLTFFHI